MQLWGGGSATAPLEQISIPPASRASPSDNTLIHRLCRLTMTCISFSEIWFALQWKGTSPAGAQTERLWGCLAGECSHFPWELTGRFF